MSIINKKTLVIYQDNSGKEPLIEWLNGLKDINVKARINNRLRRIEIGNFGDFKSVGEGVYELRFDFGAGYRVYFAEINNVIVLLLCGGDKKSQSKDKQNRKNSYNISSQLQTAFHKASIAKSST